MHHCGDTLAFSCFLMDESGPEMCQIAWLGLTLGAHGEQQHLPKNRQWMVGRVLRSHLSQFEVQ
jgi:hypothetical protein